MADAAKFVVAAAAGYVLLRAGWIMWNPLAVMLAAVALAVWVLGQRAVALGLVIGGALSAFALSL